MWTIHGRGGTAQVQNNRCTKAVLGTPGRSLVQPAMLKKIVQTQATIPRVSGELWAHFGKRALQTPGRAAVRSYASFHLETFPAADPRA